MRAWGRWLGAGIAACALMAPPAFAQFTWLPIGDEERAASTPSVDPKAGAEALFTKTRAEGVWKEGRYQMFQDRYVRIKVFTQAGADAQTRVKIFHAGSGERMLEVAARTVLPDGSTLEVPATAMKDEVAVRGQGRNTRVMSFAMPGVVPGAIIEYRWRVVSFGSAIGGFPLVVQDEIPIRRAEVDIKQPLSDDWIMQIIPYGLLANVPTEAVQGWYHCVAENVRAAADEPMAPDYWRRRGFLMPFYQMREWSDANKYWREIASAVRGVSDSKAGDAAVVTAMAREIVAGATDDRTRAQRLVRWCRREILPTTEAQDEQRFRSNVVPSTSEVIETRSGREEDAARALVALARAAGLQADQVLFETRTWVPLQKGIMTALPLHYSAVRLRGADLDVICRPRATGVPWNELHARVDGMQGLVCAESGVEFVTAPVRGAARIEREGDFQVSPSGDVEGTLQVRLTGAWAESWLERTRDRSKSEEVLREIQRSGKEGAKFSGITATVAGADSDTVTVRAQLQWPGYATVTGKRMLLQPGLWAARAPALFPAESRSAPIVFPFAWQESDSLLFHLPVGHVLEPGEPQPAFEAETILRHDTRVAGPGPEGLPLTWVRHLTVADPAKTSYSRSLYPDLRRAFQTLAERDQATLALSKATP